MTDKTQVITVRIPRHTKEVLTDVDMRKFLENTARMKEIGAIRIENNEIVLPDESVYTDNNNPDGEWVREMAHEMNTDVKTFKRHVEQGMRR